MESALRIIRTTTLDGTHPGIDLVHAEAGVEVGQGRHGGHNLCPGQVRGEMTSSFDGGASLTHDTASAVSALILVALFA